MINSESSIDSSFVAEDELSPDPAESVEYPESLKQDFTKRFEELRPGILRYFSTIEKLRPDAEDLTQEVYLRAYIAFPEFQEQNDKSDSFSRWITTIAKNHAFSALKRRNRQQERSDSYISEQNDRTGSLEEEFFAGMLTEEQEKAINNLPAEYREVVSLRFSGEAGELMEYDDIAKKLGIPPGTVKSRMSRGRALLAESLKPANPENQNNN